MSLKILTLRIRMMFPNLKVEGVTGAGAKYLKDISPVIPV